MKRISRHITVLAIGWLTPAVALAEDAYKNTARDETIAWGAIAFTALFAIAAGLIAFKPSKRTHLD